MNRFAPSILVALALSFCFPIKISAQTGHTPPPSKAADEMVKRGQTIFYAHCPMCHFGRRGQPESGRYTGPNLKGILKAAKPAKEAAVRKAILEGTPNMPGYQYMFKPGQIDDLIAYLKTYN